MFQHPYLMFPIVHDRHRRLRVAADRHRLAIASLGDRRRPAHHEHASRAPAAMSSPAVVATHATAR